ncbi:HAD family hydrolase [Hirschia baltica]|uniref:Haloacid dehalogenase domain protein hydrolase n=1 Tax=Hirschia baltica (strain ATCC 49814 / DSM 5838 / IFAM 1418) TaxID=582402 RepID=C6XMI2_HIRBI|nr:HAD family hydrolase [Hirschia baltica]ACT58125.1 Haloacid dehalogenase domain protein hydrolase [Hirschia baltica ATCC 49814]
MPDAPLNIADASFDLIGIDGDDTLWHDIGNYNLTEEKYRTILSAYCDLENMGDILLKTERKNLKIFGFGVKGYTLSLIETAIEITNGQIKAEGIQQIIDLGKEMMSGSIDILDNVIEALELLRPSYKIIVITKGDLFHQEAKFARSGLTHFFDGLEVVSNKDVQTYGALLSRYKIAPENFLMVGNSLPSDILPVLELGAWGVHIPYHTVWEMEHSDKDISDISRAVTLDNLVDVPNLLLGDK